MRLNWAFSVGMEPTHPSVVCGFGAVKGCFPIARLPVSKGRAVLEYHTSVYFRPCVDKTWGMCA